MNKKILTVLLSISLAIVIAFAGGFAIHLSISSGNGDGDGTVDNTLPTDNTPAVSTTSDEMSGTDSVTDSVSSESDETDDATDTVVSSSDKTSNTNTDTSGFTSNTGTMNVSGVAVPSNLPDDVSFDFSTWNMILANPDNPLPENFTPNLTTLTLNGYTAKMDARVADAFTKMFNDAKKEGITLIPRSTYRGIKEQSGYYYARIEQYVKQGYTREAAEAKTATIIAVPGTSEHHTGLAADITTPSYNQLDAGFANTAACKWLMEHCAEYGFILRYPKDKTDVTKIIYEPWHYRYVGVEAATFIMEHDICYEEFVAKYGAAQQ